MNEQLTLDLQPLDQSYRLIPLTKGKFAIVDAADFEWLNQWKWYSHRGGRKSSNYYAARHISESGVRKQIFMAHQVLTVSGGLRLDHINHDTLDNRRHNLRSATAAENTWNQGVRRNNRSGFKGVVYWSEMKKWRARIGVNGKRVMLGWFTTPEAAAEAYRAAARSLHGEFACVESVASALEKL